MTEGTHVEQNHCCGSRYPNNWPPGSGFVTDPGSLLFTKDLKKFEKRSSTFYNIVPTIFNDLLPVWKHFLLTATKCPWRIRLQPDP